MHMNSAKNVLFSATQGANENLTKSPAVGPHDISWSLVSSNYHTCGDHAATYPLNTSHQIRYSQWYQGCPFCCHRDQGCCERGSTCALDTRQCAHVLGWCLVYLFCVNF